MKNRRVAAAVAITAAAIVFASIPPVELSRGQPNETQAQSYTLTASSVAETANTSFDGSGDMVLVGVAHNGGWMERIEWQSMGTNAACVGTVYVDMDPDIGAELDRVPVRSTNLAATTSSTTASIPVVSQSIGRWVPPRTKIYASVTVDLTGSAGYAVSAILGNHPSEF